MSQNFWEGRLLWQNLFENFLCGKYMKYDDLVQRSSAISWYYDFHKARFRNFGGFLQAWSRGNSDATFWKVLHL
jgi:hypothetical protein